MSSSSPALSSSSVVNTTNETLDEVAILNSKGVTLNGLGKVQ